MSAASDRMLHLAQISNLLTAIGGAPHVTRPPFSVSDSAGAGLTLEPFSQVTIDRLVTYERLDARIVTPNQPSSAGVEHVQTRDNNSGHLEPDPGEYTTIRDLYDKIAAGFRSLPAEELFIVR